MSKCSVYYIFHGKYCTKQPLTHILEKMLKMIAIFFSAIRCYVSQFKPAV